VTKAQQSEAPLSRVARNRGKYRIQTLLAWLASLLAAAGIVYMLFFLWLVPVRIAGDSMAPTLQDGEVVLVDRAARFWKRPSRGEVIAFYDPAAGGLLLRRITALEGESVDVKDGQVFINGCPLIESDYLAGETPAADSAAVTVPQGMVYVLADNRTYNGDSRDSSIGCVAYTQIQGVLRVRLLPAGRLALFH